jgi:hypothetical protein
MSYEHYVYIPAKLYFYYTVPSLLAWESPCVLYAGCDVYCYVTGSDTPPSIG